MSNERSMSAGSVRVRGKMREAVDELKATISHKYPSATFSLTHPGDEPNSVQLEASVDVDDWDEVLDLVLDRVMDLQLNAGLPIHVLPRPTPERSQLLREQQRRSNGPSAETLKLAGIL